MSCGIPSHADWDPRRLDRATGTLKKPGNPMAAAAAGGAEAELPEELRPAKETKLQVTNGRQRQSLIQSRRLQRPVLSMPFAAA